MKLSLAQRKLLSQSPEVLLRHAGIQAQVIDGQVHIALNSVDPAELRKLADALEQLGITEFVGAFTYDR